VVRACSCRSRFPIWIGINSEDAKARRRTSDVSRLRFQVRRWTLDVAVPRAGAVRRGMTSEDAKEEGACSSSIIRLPPFVCLGPPNGRRISGDELGQTN